MSHSFKTLIVGTIIKCTFYILLTIPCHTHSPSPLELKEISIQSSNTSNVYVKGKFCFTLFGISFKIQIIYFKNIQASVYKKVHFFLLEIVYILINLGIFVVVMIYFEKNFKVILKYRHWLQRAPGALCIIIDIDT